MTSTLLFNIGFLDISIWDILDILIVGYLLYQVYKLLRGSLAFNIFVGIATIYAMWGFVNALNMVLLSEILNALSSVFIIALLIVFQPELRRFLLLLGGNTLKQRFNFLKPFFKRNAGDPEQKEKHIVEIRKAAEKMSRSKTGALILFTNNSNIESFTHSGVKVDAEISAPLLETIFNKETPLHDGAVIISEGKIQAASCVLPVSDNPNLPKSVGLRHRAAVGVTEGTDVVALVVSEETGNISIASEGRLYIKLNKEQLEAQLKKTFTELIYED